MRTLKVTDNVSSSFQSRKFSVLTVCEILCCTAQGRNTTWFYDSELIELMLNPKPKLDWTNSSISIHFCLVAYPEAPKFLIFASNLSLILPNPQDPSWKHFFIFSLFFQPIQSFKYFLNIFLNTFIEYILFYCHYKNENILYLGLLGENTSVYFNPWK